ncbi:hypothetical protein BDZ85DRAFT_54513 [Elsinoe ampelina]|uniref:Uncharacterized protein n=1 Tax=Elsinoe ampelina TaxID=302913 RepID=A0A6A6GLY2_9PEZI|nr:hypothetical protein BDZ85DRAFT_54513 [Elsinoe ampelina]
MHRTPRHSTRGHHPEHKRNNAYMNTIIPFAAQVSCTSYASFFLLSGTTYPSLPHQSIDTASLAFPLLLNRPRRVVAGSSNQTFP